MYLSRIKKIAKSFPFWILLASIILRIALAIVNRDASDDHIQVVARILNGLPTIETNCWECFQPKFFYYFISFFALIFSSQTSTDLFILAQMINVLFSIALLVVIWFFIKNLTISERSKYLIFGLVAFNPQLVGINIQSTNDTFVIFFSTLSLYLLLKYLNNPRWLSLAFLTISTSLALLSKGSGLAIAIWTMIILGLRTFIVGEKSKALKAFLFFSGVIIYMVLAYSPYYNYVLKYGTYFFSPSIKHGASVVSNRPHSPPLYSHTNPVPDRPGVTSILGGYFTFRFINLLEKPYDTNGVFSYPLHRTSLWSQFYANALSLHFAQWPLTWANTGSFVIFLTRMIFIFGLIPSIFFLIGFLIVVYRFISSLIKQRKISSKPFIFLLFFLVFIFSIIHYTYVYRDFSFMKIVYFYPVLLSLIFFLAEGIGFMEKISNKYSWIVKIFAFLTAILIFLQILDEITLFTQLSNHW